MVVKITVERVKVLYRYRKKAEDEAEHYLLGSGNERQARPPSLARRGAAGSGGAGVCAQADITAVVVVDGVQHRTSTARNCNDVRPRMLLGAIDVSEKNYKGDGTIVRHRPQTPTMRLDLSGPLSRKRLAFPVKLSKSGPDKSKHIVENTPALRARTRSVGGWS